MSKYFHKITVADVKRDTDSSVIITLDIPATLHNDFTYIQGQYLTLKAEINSESIQRSYSLCSSPMDNLWKVGVKQVPKGKFSTFANNELKKGDSLECMVPAGKFYVPVDPTLKRNYMAFAAGSGITPILSIIKTHLLAEPFSTFKLIYTNKTVSSIMLKEELEALKNQFIGRLEIFYLLTRQQRNIALYDGRLSEEKLDIIFDNITPVAQIDHFFSCGPEQMVFMAKDYLEAKGVEANKIHFELFTSSYTGPLLDKAMKEALSGQQAAIKIIEGGRSMDFTIEKGGDNILDAALNNAADLPFAC